MNTLSKTLDTQDYFELADPKPVSDMLASKGVAHRYEHFHRRWEYGMAFLAITGQNNMFQSILDVGGGGSIFAPFLKIHLPESVDILQVDPGDVGNWIHKQASAIKRNLEFIQQDFMVWSLVDSRKFDVVTCLSVIEHVPNDLDFFRGLCEKVKDGGLLILTTDFHPSGEAQVGGHIRTYNEEGMRKFAEIAKMYGLHPYGGDLDYSKFEVNVNSYTFASLVLRKDIDDYFRISNPE